MKKRFLHLSPKVGLALSALLLVFALGYLWMSLDYPMPTKGLALRKAELRENYPHGQIVAELDLRRELEQEDGDLASLYFGDYCLFTRQEGQPYIALMSRTAGFLWGTTYFMPLFTDHPAYLGSIQHWGVQNGTPYSDGRTELTATAVTDPAAARVTVTQCLIPAKVLRAGDERAYLEEHGVTVEAAELSPGSGVWISKQRISPPSGGDSYSISSMARVYDAAGNLLYTTEP